MTRKNRLKRHSRTLAQDARRAFVIIVICAGMALFMVYFYSFLMTAHYFQVNETVVRGCRKITEKEIIERAEVVPSMNIMSVNLEKMSRRIEAHPWVKAVSVEKKLPDTLIITVTEYKPVALLREEDALYLVDGDGVVFKKHEDADCVELPVLGGMFIHGSVDSDLLKKAFELMDFLSARKEFPQGKDISEIEGSRIYGFTVITNDRKLLHLGFNNYEKKFDRLRHLLDEALAQVNGAGFIHIYLENVNRVVVRQWSPDTGNATFESKQTAL